MAKLDCGHEASPHSDITTGYGTDHSGKTHCYDCIARLDRETLTTTGHSKNLPLYWDGKTITNWPGSLRFHPRYVRKGRHNIAGERIDVWFDGPDGFVWHGYNLGRYNQILHAKRTKQPAR